MVTVSLCLRASVFLLLLQSPAKWTITQSIDKPESTYVDPDSGFLFISSIEGGENNADWDGFWEVRARFAETGLYAEFRIPVRKLRFGTCDVQSWGVNFDR